MKIPRDSTLISSYDSGILMERKIVSSVFFMCRNVCWAFHSDVKLQILFMPNGIFHVKPSLVMRCKFSNDYKHFPFTRRISRKFLEKPRKRWRIGSNKSDSLYFFLQLRDFLCGWREVILEKNDSSNLLISK